MVPVFLARSQSDKGQQVDQQCPKPNCSYTCMIGMALRASKTGRMNVAEIYSYIRNRFPYYRNCPSNTWKNSVRHSLSLSRNFRRVGLKDGDMRMRKGLKWEVIPERQEAVEREVEIYYESRPRFDTERSTQHGQCSFLVLSKSTTTPGPLGYQRVSSPHQRSPQGIKPSTNTTHLDGRHTSKSINGVLSYAGTSSAALKRKVHTSQCHSLARMLASRQCTHLCTNEGSRSLLISGTKYLPNSGTTANTGTKSLASTRTKFLSNSGTKSSQTTRTTSLPYHTNLAEKCQPVRTTPDEGSCSDHDELYVQNLLETVDRAIASEYGPDKNTQTLTFTEIFESLENVEKKFNHRYHSKVGHKREKKRIEYKCFKSDENLTDKEGGPTLYTDDSNISFTLQSNSTISKDDSKQNTELLLLSKSEERLLLGDLEQEARKLAFGLFPYLRCAGENIASCLAGTLMDSDS